MLHIEPIIVDSLDMPNPYVLVVYVLIARYCNIEFFFITVVARPGSRSSLAESSASHLAATPAAKQAQVATPAPGLLIRIILVHACILLYIAFVVL